MMIYQVGYKIGNGHYSVNMIEGEEAKVTAVAEAHAKKHGYEIGYIVPITVAEATANRAKGMPFKKLENSQ